MPAWHACWWAVLGAALVEGLDLYNAMHSAKRFPWQVRGELKFPPYIVSAVIRLSVGGGLAALFAASHQVAGPLGAGVVGIAAPKILQEISKRGLGYPGAAGPEGLTHVLREAGMGTTSHTKVPSTGRVRGELASGPDEGNVDASH